MILRSLTFSSVKFHEIIIFKSHCVSELMYYKGPNNSRVRNNSRGRKNFQNLIIVGTGIIVGGGKCQNVGAGKNAKM